MEEHELKIRSCVFECKTLLKTHAANLISNSEMKMIGKKSRKTGSSVQWVPWRDHYCISRGLKLPVATEERREGGKDGGRKGGKEGQWEGQRKKRTSFSKPRERCSSSLSLWQTPGIHHVHGKDKNSSRTTPTSSSFTGIFTLLLID